MSSARSNIFNNIIAINVLRFLGLLLVQVFVFKSITLGNVNYFSILIYPIALMLLPYKIPDALAIFIGFVYGLLLDMFYFSMGVHAATCTFMAFIRPTILAILEPRGGYASQKSPTKDSMGVEWFFRYASIFMFVHLFFYFSVEAFTFVYISSILLKTIISFVLSIIFVMMYQYLLNPQN